MMRSLNMRTARWIDGRVGLLLCALLFAVARVRANLGGPAQPPLHATTPPLPGVPPVRPRRILAIKLYGLETSRCSFPS